MRTNRIKEGDIVRCGNGLLAQIVELDFPAKGMTRILYIDETESTYGDTQFFERQENLGQSPHIVAVFTASHGIHVRLNRMAKL